MSGLSRVEGFGELIAASTTLVGLCILRRPGREEFGIAGHAFLAFGDETLKSAPSSHKS